MSERVLKGCIALVFGIIGNRLIAIFEVLLNNEIIACILGFGIALLLWLVSMFIYTKLTKKDKNDLSEFK